VETLGGLSQRTTASAGDDVVATREEAAAARREPLVVTEPLAAFLDEQGLGAGELVVSAIGDGHSNATFLVRRGRAELVLRRPPRGPLPPSAHDVLREARVMRAVAGRVRVPRVLATCADEAVIGAPFYLMEKVDGHVVGAAVPDELDGAGQRRRIGEELVDALVEIHAADWRACGLEGYGRPTGYTERQVRRFMGLWEHNRTREIPEVEQVGRWLAAHLPDSPAATLVHGDFRLGNVVFAARAPAQLTAVLDWEMSTIGDPLADLGYLCTFWVSRDDPPRTMFQLPDVTRQEGFLVRDELIARYAERSGRSVRDIRWYQTLALWKYAIFMEGNYKRAMAGASDDAWAKGFRHSVTALAELADAFTRERGPWI
jgi:aminoglycoside phosphotransferase (APT) family kinase protein